MNDKNQAINFWIMNFLLFLFWFLLSGSFNFFSIVIGLILSYLIFNLSIRFFGNELEFWYRPRQLLLLTNFFVSLISEIIKANLNMAWIIINPKLPVSPGIVKFKTGLKSDLAKVILANTITLTPGTLTIDINGDEFIVHIIAKESIEGLLSNELEKLLSEIEGN
ncbi:Na+/H+ antiporter subunit E [Acetohalobium arabaticum]|uniref:Multisubunit sodium/proton antiporter, MrpE subunit (2.A.63.1) n=1 Tax=Acetohalobium arabaticum (strain ATCC 49924 / DSM 5501 / Z-7288) TaxID=574087 RepID=D9QQ22_ACEAZ|nr:Na+/H+ antiporter subunit E [Acetohalobium arabaticum]ADL12613.1 multisubunit sodium/proton antiporter, MrpE subunit (2.A.63.1) [Acetohalobium arabaticum DSM 5501]